MSTDAITAILERESAYRHNCGPFGHVSQEQATQAFSDIATLLTHLGTTNDALSMQLQRDQALRDVDRYKMMHRVAEDHLNDNLIQLQERDARYANDKRDADGDPASLCNICKGMIRYGERHSTCGAAFMQVERALESKQAECDRLRNTLVTVTAERDACNLEISAALNCFADLAVRVREGGGPENLCASLAVSVLKVMREVMRLKQELIPFTAALAEVRGEIPELQQSLGFLNDICQFAYQHGYHEHGYDLVKNVGYAINSLQLRDAGAFGAECAAANQVFGPGGTFGGSTDGGAP
jgi:hypothetical protein